MPHAKQSNWGRTIFRIATAMALGVLILFAAGIQPSVQFPREQIDIQVHDDHIEVSGLYVYHNPWPFPVRQGLSIPFAVDAQHAPPIRLSVHQVTPEEKTIPVRYWVGKHRFEVSLPGRSEISVRVGYYQYTPGGDARYLLTTTQPWRKPLDHGLYRLFPHGVVIKSSTYALTEIEPAISVFERSNFMPQKDWCFAWRTK